MAAASDRNGAPTNFDLGPWWRGEGRLAPLYWGWGVLASLVLAAVVAVPVLRGWAGAGWATAGRAGPARLHRLDPGQRLALGRQYRDIRATRH